MNPPSRIPPQPTLSTTPSHPSLNPLTTTPQTLHNHPSTLSHPPPHPPLPPRTAGEVVGISDTGVDEDSCYFYDPKGRVPRSDISNPVTYPQYRKIIQYVNYSGR